MRVLSAVRMGVRFWLLGNLRDRQARLACDSCYWKCVKQSERSWHLPTATSDYPQPVRCDVCGRRFS